VGVLSCPHWKCTEYTHTSSTSMAWNQYSRG